MTQSTRAKTAADDARPTIDPTTVVGWGVDADPENDPTWPMRDRSMDDGPGLTWDRPATQETDVEILQSVEHERRPATFGTSTPPRGLSGAIRRRAFAFSESQWGHWLLLMLADRINSMEGVIDDFRRGRAPDPLGEMGLVRATRSREAALVTWFAIGAGVLATAWVIRRARR